MCPGARMMEQCPIRRSNLKISILDLNDTGLKLLEVRLQNKCCKICVLLNLDLLECFLGPLTYHPVSNKTRLVTLPPLQTKPHWVPHRHLSSTIFRTLLSNRPEGSRGSNKKLSMTSFQRSCVVVKMYSPLRRRFVLDFGKQTAAWRRLQWPDCSANEMK